MGLAASQARLLTITARLADNELRSQTINNAKMRLATQSSQASDEYISALNNAQLMFSNTDINGLARTQALTYNNLVAYSQYNNQYGLVNSAGLLLVSEQDAENYKNANGDLDKFLEGYGLTWGTTFFNSIDDYDAVSGTGGLQSTLIQSYGNSNTGTASAPRWDYGKLFEGMSNEDLRKIYEYGTSDEASIEKLNYGNIAQAYYNEVKDAYTNAIPLLRSQMLGNSTNAAQEEEIAQQLAALAEAAGRGNGDRLLRNELMDDTGFSYDCSKFNFSAIEQYLTPEAKTYLTNLIESLTDRTNAATPELAGFMDITLSGPTPGTGTTDYKKRKTPSGVPHSASEVYETVTPSGCPYDTIAFGGVTFGIKMPVLQSDGTVSWYDTDDTTVIGTENVEKDTGVRRTQIIEPATDGQGATLTATSIANINNYIQNFTAADFSDPAKKKRIAELMEAELDHTDPGTGQSTGMLPCVYRYIDDTDTIVRIPMKYVRNRADEGSSGMSSAYVALVHEFFDSILDHPGFINLSALLDDPNLSTQPGLTSYSQAIKDFKQYDTEPVLKDSSGNFYHPGDSSLENLCQNTPGYLLNFGALLEAKGEKVNAEIKAFLADPNYDPDFGSEAFRSVILAYMADLMVDVLGEPKYAWIDANDPNVTQNADSKAQWYENLFNRMKRGYKVLENGLANSKEWIEYAFESGLVTMEQVDKSYNWIALDYKTCSNIYEDSDTSDLVAKAEAKYNRAMNDIKQKDNMYDLQLKNIDTEHSALQTEYDSVKGVISKNLDRTMKFDQSA